MIGSPLVRLIEFAELDGTYQGYDQISPDPFAIISRSGEVADALRRVPTDATLAAPAEQLDWDALYGLYRSLSGLPAVGVPRMTKVLHRKRPCLVPILDEVVRSYLCEVEPPRAQR